MRQAFRCPAHAQFQQPVFFTRHRRVLAEMAHLIVNMVSGLLVYPHGRESSIKNKDSAQHPPDVRGQRLVAWRELDICGMGHIQCRFVSSSVACGAEQKISERSCGGAGLAIPRRGISDGDHFRSGCDWLDILQVTNDRACV
jgi:hypothetical protein